MNDGLFSSLRARLILGAVIWITLGVTVAGIFVAELFRQHATEVLSAQLRAHLEELSSIIDVEPDGTPRLYRLLSEPRFVQPESGLAWQVDRNGVVLVKSRSISTETMPIPATVPSDDEDVRAINLQSPRGLIMAYDRMLLVGDSAPMHVQVGAEERILDEQLRDFNLSLAGSLALLALALVVAAILQVAFGLQPMVRLRSALTAVKSGDAARLPRSFPSEVQPLVDDLNTMIEANKEMLARARAQAGNLAHGLKTPLAILSDEAYRLQTRGQTESAATIAQQSQRMQRQIDFQIARARAAASRSVPGVIAAATPVVTGIIGAMTRLYAEKNLRFDVRIEPGCVAQCDPMDLNEMLANLIDNACKWAVATVAITGAVDDATHNVVLAVEDDGPGLPAEKMEVVFHIGERLDETVPGSGLGLPIVRDLAQLYGGAVRLEKSPRSRLKATLVLPRAR